MSSRRKALMGIFEQTSAKLAAANPEPEQERRTTAGPVRTMALTLGKMGEEARALQEAFNSGQHIQELDPALVDPSFVRDRIEDVAFDADDLFVRSIAESGQAVPILVRPHPAAEGRYQVAYGHRRLKAAKVLGIKVRAVVREFDDEALIIAQGVENSERQSLSFIDRAIFALRLEEAGFQRPVIMMALSTDKTELSKLISVASAIPADVVQAIGSAHNIGRRRWLAFASSLRSENTRKIQQLLSSDALRQKPSDERFEAAFAALQQNAEPVTSKREWKPRNGGKLTATIRSGDKSYALSLKQPDAGPFGEFLSARLDELYDEFRKSKGD